MTTSQKFKDGQLEQAFRKAARAGDLRAQVALARGTVRALIMNGGIDGDLHDPINRLVGDTFEVNLSTPGEAVWINYCNHLDAAVAIGIAIGQLVHPDVFKKGGA